MASAISKTIEIIFAGVDNVSGAIKNIGSNVEDFGSNIQDIGQPFADATEKVLTLGVAVAGLGILALKASNDIDAESKKMAASLGLTNEEAKKFEDIAKDVYKGGFTDDLSSAFALVTDAQRRFGENAEVDIGKVAIQATKLQKVFDVDYDRSLRAANSLMDNFGISSTDAFDFITKGFQKGLNGSDDFLDSISEYGVQFKNGGADAGEFFSVMETGFVEGLNGTDKAADAFKEFRVRIQDGSKTTADALASIGIDNEALQSNLTSGKTSIIEAFQTIITKIKETDDKGVAFRAGVGLLGTQFEDMGTTAAKNLDVTKTKIGDLQGAIDKIDTQTLGTKFNSLYRTIKIGITEQDSWNKVKKILGETFEDIGESFEKAINDIDLSELEGSLGELWEAVAGIFKDSDLDLTSVEGMKNAIQLVIDSTESLALILKGLAEIFSPIVELFVKAVEYFNSLDSETKELVGNILGLGTALVGIGGLLATGGAIIGGFGALGLLITGPVGIFALAATAIGTTVAAIKKLAGTQDRVNASVAAAAEGHIVYRGKIVDTQKELAKATEETKWLHIATGDLVDADNPDIQVVTNTGEVISIVEAFTKTIEEIPEEKTVDIIVDGRKIGEVAEGLMEEFPDKFETEVDILVNQDKINQAKKELDEVVPDKKEVEIDTTFNKDKAELQLKELEINAKTLQSSFKYKAEVDTAQIRAATALTEASFSSLTETLSGSAEVLQAFAGAYAQADTSTQKSFLEDMMRDEGERRDKELDLQGQLIEKQLEAYEARAAAAERGESLITVDGSGLQPHLEAIMWEVLEAIQVRANEEGSAALLGLTV